MKLFSVEKVYLKEAKWKDQRPVRIKEKHK